MPDVNHDLRDHTGIPGVSTLGAWTAFTPTWTAATTNPTLGNGTLTGRYKALDSKTYAVVIEVLFGSTTTPGSGTYTFGNLPFTVKSTAPTYQSIGGFIKDVGTASYVLTARLPAGSTGIDAIACADGTGTRHVSDIMPVTWAAGDVIHLQGIVEAN